MIRRLPMVLAPWLLLAAGAQASTPLDYTRTILDQARTIVASNQSQTGKLATLSVLFGKFLDSDEMGRQARGGAGRTLRRAAGGVPSPFPSTASANLCADLTALQKPEFVYAGQHFTGTGVTVDTKIIRPRDQFDVTGKLFPAGDGWLAIAINVENVGLTSNLGSQFNRLPAQMSPDDLLALMRRKYGNPGGEA